MHPSAMHPAPLCHATRPGTNEENKVLRLKHDTLPTLAGRIEHEMTRPNLLPCRCETSSFRSFASLQAGDLALASRSSPPCHTHPPPAIAPVGPRHAPPPPVGRRACSLPKLRRTERWPHLPMPYMAGEGCSRELLLSRLASCLPADNPRTYRTCNHISHLKKTT